MAKQYGTQTAGVISLFSQSSEEELRRLLDNIKIEESKKQRVYLKDAADGGKHLHIERPTDKERANVIMLASLEEGLRKGVLAKEYLNISPQHFSMIIGEKQCNKASLDLIVCAALVLRHPFGIDQVDHVLMEIERAGLFTDTYDEIQNLRNYILRKLLAYAQEHECPRERWLFFGLEVLAFLGMKPLQEWDNVRVNLSIEEEEMILDWMEEAKKVCGKTNYMVRRNRYLNRYAQENGISLDDAITRLADEIPLDRGSVRDVFASEFSVEGTRGRRDTLILGAIRMNCTMEETNRMLREANYALLYPFRENPDEIVHIALLLQNEIVRKGGQS